MDMLGAVLKRLLKSSPGWEIELHVQSGIQIAPSKSSSLVEIKRRKARETFAQFTAVPCQEAEKRRWQRCAVSPYLRPWSPLCACLLRSSLPRGGPAKTEKEVTRGTRVFRLERPKHNYPKQSMYASLSLIGVNRKSTLRLPHSESDSFRRCEHRLSFD